jgi:NAD(P)-dependent dehydrogenase (short-subunit alcohol dehydrogenase family)
MSILDRFSLKDKVVILTGGAGLYGCQLTSALAEAGSKLVIASRDLKKLKQIAGDARNSGATIACEAYDQADEKSILQLRDRVLQQFGRIDGLVNNSVARPMKSLHDPINAWEDSMRVNASGVFLMMRAMGEVMCRQQSGSIVNVGSMQGMIGPCPELYEGTNLGVPPPDYFFHKAGLINLSRYFASIYGPKNVRVNCVSAGGFSNKQPEPFVTNYNRHTMLGRMAGENDLGGAIVFLLSDASGYITAANLPVDGGYTSK